MSNIFLTSGGFNTVNKSVSQENYDFFKQISIGKSVIIISNAAPEGTGNYKARANVKDNFLNVGAKKADVIDLDETNISDILNYDIIYMLSGNVTYLIELNQKTNFKNILIEFLKNGIYIGESAGSMILGPNLKYIYDIKKGTKPKYNTILESYAGLNFVDMYIYPHFQKASSESKSKVSQYEVDNNISITRLNDGDIISVQYDI